MGCEHDFSATNIWHGSACSKCGVPEIYGRKKTPTSEAPVDILVRLLDDDSGNAIPDKPEIQALIESVAGYANKGNDNDWWEGALNESKMALYTVLYNPELLRGILKVLYKA